MMEGRRKGEGRKEKNENISVECRPINIDGVTELGNDHLTTIIAIINPGKKH